MFELNKYVQYELVCIACFITNNPHITLKKEQPYVNHNDMWLAESVECVHLYFAPNMYK